MERAVVSYKLPYHIIRQGRTQYAAGPKGELPQQQRLTCFFPLSGLLGTQQLPQQHHFAVSLLVEQLWQLNHNPITKGTCLTIPETENPRGGIAFPEVTALHTRGGEVSHKWDADYKTILLFP